MTGVFEVIRSGTPSMVKVYRVFNYPGQVFPEHAAGRGAKKTNSFFVLGLRL